MSEIFSAPVTVFDPAESDRYHTYRIPSIIRHDQSLLAFCEGRINGSGDAGEIEIVLRRSPDAGVTWLPEQVVAAAPGMTCGNPSAVVDPASGDIVLLSVQNGADADEHTVARGTDPKNGRRVYLQRSTDGGARWTDPAEITDQVKPKDWGWYATGPCHAIALEHGPDAGRLVVPANHSFVPDDIIDRSDPEAMRLNGGHCILSDDGGHTWRIGFVDRNDQDTINANETTVTELADGRLYFNARNHQGSGSARVHAWSPDGGESLDEPYAEIPEITAPGIQGSVFRHGNRLLLTTPTDPERRRVLTVLVSEDDGANWRTGTVAHDGMAGYSDLVALPDGQVGLFYEGGEESSFATLRFQTFDPTVV